MATKLAQGGRSRAPSARARASAAPPHKDVAPRAPRAPTLTATETPGVYLNKLGVKCDAKGVALTFKQLRAIDVEVTKELGNDAQTLDPLVFMKSVMSNPDTPMHVRMDAAKAIATYTHRKPSQGVDGGLGPDGQPLPLFTFNLDVVKHWPEERVRLVMEAFKELGVAVSEPLDTESAERAKAMVATALGG